MAHGAGNYHPDPERQRQYLEEIARHQDVHPDMLLGVLGVGQTIEIDAYQIVTEPDNLLNHPLPFTFQDDHTEVARSITNNTAMYDDDTEDLIASDRVIEGLKRLPSTEERAAAIRARRTILTLILNLPNETTAPEASKSAVNVA